MICREARRTVMELDDIIALTIGAGILIIVIAYMITNQKSKCLEWLKYAVCEAERILGEKTGQLKLRAVYDWFCDKFHVLAAILPFRVFSAWVDVALQTMDKWLECGNKIGDYITGIPEKGGADDELDIHSGGTGNTL